MQKTLGVVALNALFFAPMLTFVDCLLRFDYVMTSEQIPSLWTNLWQFAFFLMVEEVTFYFAHLLLHNPKYYWIHKKHHEYNITVTLAAEYAHPIEHLLANTICTGLGFKLLSGYANVHIFTVIIWMTFRVLETCDGHSGYDWSWAQSGLFPFSGGGRYHYFHHKQNSGNYAGILSFMDTLFDTNKEFREENLKKSAIKK